MLKRIYTDAASQDTDSLTLMNGSLAGRGGNKAKLYFCGGDQIEDVAWYLGNSKQHEM
jgi:hypothetical protein